MSDTPEIIETETGLKCVTLENYRELERERDEAQERECAAIESWWEEYQRALREGQRVVELREENAKLRDIAETAIDWLKRGNLDDKRAARYILEKLNKI